MTANLEQLLPGAIVLLDAESAHLDITRGERATVVHVEQDRHVTCRVDRTGAKLAFSPDELILVPTGTETGS